MPYFRGLLNRYNVVNPLLLGLMLCMLSTSPSAAETADIAQLLRNVASWHYQLQNIELDTLSRSNADLIVIDYAHAPPEGDMQGFTKAEVARLQVKPDGGRRLVLAYLSIGEAEEYRFYWKSEFASKRPDWYVAPSQGWPDNHRVRYWMPEWQDIVYRGQQSYLDRILDAGFDGVYLDRIDVHEPLKAQHPDARKAMIEFVAALALKARQRVPQFVVLAQNAEELLDDPAYGALVDGIAKEDYLFGLDRQGRRNDPDLVQFTTDKLRLMKADGKLVLVVEYPTLPQHWLAHGEIEMQGFIPLFARRALDGPPPEAPDPAVWIGTQLMLKRRAS